MDDTEIHMEHFRATHGRRVLNSRKRKWELSGEQAGAELAIIWSIFLRPLALRKDRIDLKCFDAEAILARDPPEDPDDERLR